MAVRFKEKSISGLGVCFKGFFDVHYATIESMTFLEVECSICEEDHDRLYFCHMMNRLLSEQSASNGLSQLKCGVSHLSASNTVFSFLLISKMLVYQRKDLPADPVFKPDLKSLG